MNNSVFEKAMDKVLKHRDIKLVTINRKRNYLVSEPNCHTEKWFSKNILAIEMSKMNMSVYLDLSTVEVSKTLIYEFWYRYIKPRYQNNAYLCYMDTDSFVTHIYT